jgi:ribokinase
VSAARVVCVGDVMLDVVATTAVPLARGSDAPARVRTHGGGSAANVAAWLGSCGVPVLLVARVGDDTAGRAQVAELEAGGVDVRAAVDPVLATGTCVVVVEPDGERTFLPDRGASEALCEADLPRDVFRAGDHLHLSGYALLHGGPGPAMARAALARAHAAGMSTSVDPASSAPLRRLGAEQFLGAVAGAGLLVPNADEAAVLTGEEDPERAAGALARRLGGEVAVTLGANGALWSDGEAVVCSQAVPVRGDSTGAGDAWAAGWLGARLGGAGVAEALRAAGALGALAVALAGARPHRP